MPGDVGAGGAPVGPAALFAGGGTGPLLVSAVVDLVADVLREIRVINAVDPAGPEDQAYVLRKVNRILDRWNADRQTVFQELIASFTCSPGVSPHTIGPSTATWTTGQRPVSLEAAAWAENAAGSRTPIAVRNSSWWMRLPDKASSSSFPTDVYFEPAWPNGNLYFWPVPTAARVVDLQMRVVLGMLALGDRLSMPPGYLDAIIKTAAEECVGQFGVDMPAGLPQFALDARAVIFGNNGETLPLENDAPGSGAGGYFDYQVGRYV